MAADETFDVLLRVKSEGDEALKVLTRQLALVQAETKKTAAALQQTGESSNRFRSGLQNLGFQAQDFAVQVGGGTSALRAFSQQMPQAIGAMQTMFAETSALGKFLGGPWGVFLGLAAAALGPLIAQLFKTEEAAKDAKKELENFSTWEGLSAQAAKANALAVSIKALQDQFDKLPSGPSKEAKAFAATTDEGRKLTKQIAEQTAAYNKLNPVVQQQLELLRRSDVLTKGLTEGDKRRAEEARKAAEKAPKAKVDHSAENAAQDAADLLARSLAIVGDAFRKMDEEAKAAQKTQDDFIKTLERAADPSKAFAEELGKLTDLYDQHKISQEAFDVAVAKSFDTLNSAVAKLNENPVAEKVAANQKAAAQEVIAAWQSVGDAIGDAFGQLLAKTSSVRDVVRSLVADILSQLAKIAIKKFVAKIFTSAAASARGNVFDSKGMVPFASGGVVTQPTIFPFAGGTGLMGEAGPEAIMPLQRDAQGKLGVAAAPVSINVINNAGAAVSVQETGPGKIDIIIARAVEASRAAIASDFRRGGSDVSRSVERAYGVNRGAGAF